MFTIGSRQKMTDMDSKWAAAMHSYRAGLSALLSFLLVVE